jgi:hypothetical protein
LHSFAHPSANDNEERLNSDETIVEGSKNGNARLSFGWPGIVVSERFALPC